MRNRFHKGVFNCECCGRATRGQADAIGIDLCNQCYDLAGYDNMHNDDGRAPTAEELAEYEALLEEIKERGGDAEFVRRDCPYLFDAHAH